MPGALHLRHLCKRIQFGILQHIGRLNPVNGYKIRKDGPANGVCFLLQRFNNNLLSHNQRNGKGHDVNLP